MTASAGIGQEDAVEFSLDPGRVDIGKLHAFLSRSYWAKGRTLETVRTSLAHSLAVSAHRGGEMVGFARAVSDEAVFAYVMDVAVWPEHRGRGIGRHLIAALIDHPRLRDVGQWYLRTRDAHGVYSALGFRPVEDGYFMRLSK